MRPAFLVAIFLISASELLVQASPDKGLGLPHDPAEILAAAAPYYNFNDPTLKPWHLKASYHLFNEKGKPVEQGVFEYWWASPLIHRSSWTRPDAARTDWHAAGGKVAYLASGNSIELFERKMKQALLRPLPRPEEYDALPHRFEGKKVRVGDYKFRCVEVIPFMPPLAQSQPVPIGWLSTYCFEPTLPILRASLSLGGMTIEFARVVGVQDRFLPRQIVILEQGKKILTAQVDEINSIQPDDPALTPPPAARLVHAGKAEVEGKVMAGMLIRKEVPHYPLDAKEEHISGTVVLDATIGMDGAIHDLSVESAPWPSLAASALWAVSHWKYRPYTINGEPVEVHTTISVIYTLGR